MSTYRIFWTTSASTVTEVEADSLDDAIEASFDQLPGSLCHQCARACEMSDEWVERSAYVDDGDVDLLAAPASREDTK